MTAIRELYNSVCEIMLEPGGFHLGILTDAEFLGYYKSTMEDFLGRTGMIKGIIFLQQFAGVSQYEMPSWICDPIYMFSDGAQLRSDFEGSIAQEDRYWQSKIGQPRSWRADKLPDSFFSVYPAPAINTPFTPVTGTNGVIAAWVPGGDLSQNQAFIGTMVQASQVGTFTTPGDFFGTGQPLTLASRGDLAAIGTLMLFTEDVDLDDPIEHLDDDWLPIIKFGILQRIFMTDGETRDMLRERWAWSRYEEGVALGQALMEQVIDSN